MIQPGDSGIWATCNKGKERQCIGELRDFFNEHAEMLYGDIAVEETTGAPTADTEITSPSGIENEIQDEIVELQKPSSVQLFTPVRVEVQCGECAYRWRWTLLICIKSPSSKPLRPSSPSGSSKRFARTQ